MFLALALLFELGLLGRLALGGTTDLDTGSKHLLELTLVTSLLLLLGLSEVLALLLQLLDPLLLLLLLAGPLFLLALELFRGEAFLFLCSRLCLGLLACRLLLPLSELLLLLLEQLEVLGKLFAGLRWLWCRGSLGRGCCSGLILLLGGLRRGCRLLLGGL